MISRATTNIEYGELNSFEETYQALQRNLRRRRGFGLLFVQCSPSVGERIVRRTRHELSSKIIKVLSLNKPIKTLYGRIEELQSQEKNDILFISGIEKSLIDYIKPGIGGQGFYYKLDSVPPILGHLNLQRERFRDDLDICFVFLVPQFALKFFVRRAPDFFDWRSGVFIFPKDAADLAQELQKVSIEGGYAKYLSLSSHERREKILEIHELDDGKQQSSTSRASLQFEIGTIYLSGKENIDAITAYNYALQLNPKHIDAYIGRGVALDNLGRYEEAIAAYDQALQLDPKKAGAWHNQGVALDNLGRYEEAIAAYDQALQLDPEDINTWLGRGVALDNLGRYEEAIAAYDRALQLDPKKAGAWHNQGVVLDNLGRYEEAIVAYNQALQLDPGNANVCYQRGVTLRKLERYEEAIVAYDQALQLDPKKASAWHNKGFALDNLKRYEEAIVAYDQALQLVPDNGIIWYNKSCCYAAQNNIELALENLQQAINLNSECREIAKTDSDFDGIRNDKRFQSLVSSISKQKIPSI